MCCLAPKITIFFVFHFCTPYPYLHYDLFSYVPLTCMLLHMVIIIIIIVYILVFWMKEGWLWDWCWHLTYNWLQLWLLLLIITLLAIAAVLILLLLLYTIPFLIYIAFIYYYIKKLHYCLVNHQVSTRSFVATTF